MNCAHCGSELPDGFSYLAIYAKSDANADHAEVSLLGCCYLHPPPQDREGFVGVFSPDCATKFMREMGWFPFPSEEYVS